MNDSGTDLLREALPDRRSNRNNNFLFVCVLLAIILLLLIAAVSTNVSLIASVHQARQAQILSESVIGKADADILTNRATSVANHNALVQTVSTTNILVKDQITPLKEQITSLNKEITSLNNQITVLQRRLADKLGFTSYTPITNEYLTPKIATVIVKVDMLS